MAPGSPIVNFSAGIEGALLHQLQRTWDGINRERFHEAMRPPVLGLSDGDARLGSWRGASRTIEISRRLVREQPWGVVVEVLKHEMAHQYVDEVLNVRDETAHGPAFREICARLGIDAAASGAVAAESRDEWRVMARITKLLALADSPNTHEAQAAMNAAHRLMLKHNLGALGSEVSYGVRYVGEPRARTGAAEKILAGILVNHFFVRAIWVPVYIPFDLRQGHQLELCGTPANLDIAAYVHAYVLETAERSWREHRRLRGIGGDRDRRRYVAGLMMGFADQLRTQTAVCAEEGLVWVGDPGLEDWVGRRFPRLRRTATRVVTDDAWAHGREAGRHLVLRKPVTANPTRRGRLLGG